MKKRAYKQNCALALASDLLGERWTFLILRELLVQPCRFKQLNMWLQGMGTNLLASRLKELESDGIIEKLEPSNKRSAYQLTTTGWQLESVILPLIRWGYLYGEYQRDYLHYDHWDLLALKAFFNQGKGKQGLIVQFESDSLLAWVEVGRQGYLFGFGFNTLAQVKISGNMKTFQQELQAGKYADNKMIKSFVDWFEVPSFVE